jgi:hypothetical protein
VQLLYGTYRMSIRDEAEKRLKLHKLSFFQETLLHHSEVDIKYLGRHWHNNRPIKKYKCHLKRARVDRYTSLQASQYS